MDRAITMQMLESRRAERVRSFLRARIVFNHQNSSVDCIVKNISSTGAKIEITDAVTVPSEFDLVIPQKARTYRARIMWRDAEAMGVEFIEDTVSALDSARDPRIERLERENKRLKMQMAALVKRLEDIGQAVDLII